MQNRLQERVKFVLIGIIIVLIPIYLVYDAYYKNRKIQNTNEYHYVGRSTCIECHVKEYELWKGSHHDRAMDHASDSTVLGDFNNAEIISADGTTHKFYKKDDKFMVYTDGEDGSMQEYEVKFTFGYTPLQQYLVEFDKGRLQTLPLTWNSVDSCWYHMVDSVYKNEKIDHGNWLHWTNQAQNWNSMCADCHSTNLVKGYNVETDSYNTSYSEIDVSCEACHGPSSKHLEWANLPEYSRTGFENYGLTVKTSNIDNKTYVDQCARCHTRRSALQDYFPSDTGIFNHMIPVLPVEPQYFIDGQILDEDYVYGSFTQSKMYMHDVRCNDCHDVHSGERLFEGNKLCLQCHQAETYDNKAHHFHKMVDEDGDDVISESGVRFEVGSGTECVNCHMHGRYYMGVDYRNDHSFRIPRPDLSEKYGVPNACNQCHNNKSNHWAHSYIEKWYGKSRHFQYGEAFALAQKQKNEGLVLLKSIIGNDLYPEIIRATAMQYVGGYFPDSAASILMNYLHNMNELLRFSALRYLELNSLELLDEMLPLLYDEVKAIRIECASKFVAIPVDQIPEKYKPVLKKVNEEYHESLKYNADFPTGKYSLANYYYNNQQYKEAEKFYTKALKQDSALHQIKINLAYLYNTTGKPDKAALLFEGYLKYYPNDGEVMYSFGLLLSELKQYDKSLTYLLKAFENQPNNARIAYNIANMYDFMEEKKLAETFFVKSCKIEPDNVNYYVGLLNFYIANNDRLNISKTVKVILERFPEHPERKQFEELLLKYK